jgi:hypothetical protein
MRGRCQVSGRIDPGIVRENIDAAKPGARGFGNLIGRGVGGQIR